MVKNLIISWMALTLLCGCEPTKIAFAPADINGRFVKNLLTTAQETDTVFNNGNIFLAQLDEDYIDRDGIAEETVVNTESKKPKMQLAKKGLSYQMYIITTGNSQDPCVFLPSIFTADGDCIGLGPALVGVAGAGELKFFKKLEYIAGRKTNTGHWEYALKESTYKNRKEHRRTIYDPMDESKTKIEIKFIAKEKKNINSLTSFTINNIIKISDNYLGGNKPLVFNITDIFEDPDALAFIHFNPLP